MGKGGDPGTYSSILSKYNRVQGPVLVEELESLLR